MNTDIFENHYPSLAQDYVLGRGEARSLFRFTPDARGIEECVNTRAVTAMPGQLYDILKRQNKKYGADKKTMKNIEHLKDPRCLTVVTGQQIGLLGGPLYVVFKILKAVHTAESLSSSLDRPVVPVFWIGANDHDFEEINNVTFIDKNNTVRSLRYETQCNPHLSCGRIPVDHPLQELIKEYLAGIRDTEFTSEIRELLKESYAQGMNLCSSFFTLSARLYSQFGLVILDPSDPEFIDLIRPVLLKECGEYALSSEEIFMETAERVSRQGYHIQVQPEKGRLHAFWNDNGIRRALFFDNGEVKDRQGNRVDTGSITLSTHVLSRNLCQDAVFNTAAYIAGPGEISYCALLKGIYEVHGIVMPVILSRYMGTLIDKRTLRSLETLKTGPEHFILNPKDKAVHDVFNLESHVDIDNLKGRLEGLADDFTDAVKGAFPQEKDQGFLKGAASLNKNIKSNLNNILGGVRKREKERTDTALRRASEASDMLLPEGKLQERVLNIFQFMNFYSGRGFLQNVSDLIRNSEEGHHIWKM